MVRLFFPVNRQNIVPATFHTFLFAVRHPFGNPLFLAAFDWQSLELSPFVLATRPARKGISPYQK